nr:HNH endonuclease domain-containing protein [uncultured Enterobacter sp.]
MRFYQVSPSLENFWRGVILFGNNFATYKFALAHALYDVERRNALVSLEDLAVPFSHHVCAHLKQAPRQILNDKKPGKFLTACLQFTNGDITQDELLAVTVRHGFSVVLDAFHNVNGGAIDAQFFINERRDNKSIRLTDEFYRLAEHPQFHNLQHETDARWRLVETAWALDLPPQLLDVHYDPDGETLFTLRQNARITLTSCRNSLNGYQKGHCFYCHAPISLVAGHPLLADVDHFIPLAAQVAMPGVNLNGVWNLVLACQACNRGVNGKSARVPTLDLLKRLHARNEYFINSKLPLHEAILNQTGHHEQKRRAFLNANWKTALHCRFHQWQPVAQGEVIL